MRRSIFWIVVLAAVAWIGSIPARAADCTPINGPHGYYGNLWCNPSAKPKRGTVKKKRAKRQPERRPRKRPRRTVTERVDTDGEKKQVVKSESLSEKPVQTENSSIAHALAQPEKLAQPQKKSGDQTAAESETKPASEATAATATSSANCTRYIPTVKTVSVPCQKGDGTAATCKQYVPSVKTVSVPCE